MSLTVNIVKETCPPVLYRFLHHTYHRWNLDGIDTSEKFSNKIFCVGFHKTGTTSLEHVLREFGYLLGDQAVGELLMLDEHRDDYDRLIRFCETAQAFQDTPFCFPEVFPVLDEAFDDAKFILTVRDSEEQWFDSLIRFHTKLFSSDDSRPPTEADLANAKYRYRGFLLDLTKRTYQYPETPLYDKASYIQRYLDHIEHVKSHFSGRPNKLLVLNVAHPQAYQQVAEFLHVKVSREKAFPWKNKTSSWV